MHIGGIEYEIREVRDLIRQKADRHEFHSLNSRVDSLERTLSNLSAEVDGLRRRVSQVEENERLRDMNV